MLSIGRTIADWFHGHTQLNGVERSRARAAILVLVFYWFASLGDGLLQLLVGAEHVQTFIILAQSLTMVAMLALVKLTGRYRLAVGLHLLITQGISCWSMRASAWVFDPMLVHLPLRIIIASYILGVRWSALIGGACAAACYLVYALNAADSPAPLPTGPMLVAGTWRIAFNALLMLAVTSTLSDYYSWSLQKQSSDIADNRERTFRTARYHRLGHMLGELNHHINNPLAIIEASFYRLKSFRGTVPRAASEKDFLLQPIEQSIRRILYIVNDLQLIARMDQSEPEQVDSVRNICKNLLLTTEEIWNRHRMHLQFTDLTQNTSFICRPYQLVRILGALVINACEAMAGKPGTVEITIGVNHNLLEFHVSDAGPGVPKDLEPRIFEPFFTTKPAPAHVGLSLASSRNIIEQWGGSLRYEPRQDGASFCVSFPLRRPEQQGVA